jgi:hypothetical protein
VLLGCPAPKGSAASGSSTKGGLGSLLSQPVTPAPSSATLADAAATPSLTAPAADLLGPLPRAHHHAAPHHHRGLLGQWAHDVWSIF